ncbi:MAG: hypothetical protein K2X82_30425, partial [Gemmataceae bacterium]|nr:hypothetical protein [Gemmataceae bacterium]
MPAFPLDPRQRVLADCRAGLTYAAVARKYTASAEWVRILHKRFRETGEVAARGHATKRRPHHARHEAELRAAVAARPDRTPEQLRPHLGGGVRFCLLKPVGCGAAGGSGESWRVAR